MPSWKKLLVSGSDATLNSLQVTNNVTAAEFSGSFSGSFQGDGSGLTGIVFDIGEAASFSTAFDSQTTVTVVHNLDTELPLVQVYDTSNELFIPLTVKVIDEDTIRVDFSIPFSGKIVIAKGGHLIQGAAADSDQLNGESGSFYLDFDNFTNIPAFDSFPYTGSAIISGSLDVIGPLTATTFVGVLSSSNQIASEISGAFTSVSQSIASDIAALVQDSGSFSTRISDLEQFSSSAETFFVSETEFALASGSFLVTASISDDTLTLVKGDGTSFDLTIDNVQNATSASFALTASYLEGYISPFPYTGSAIITGSLEVIGGTISGSFIGDGSGLTGVNVTVESQTSFAYSFTLETTVTVNHSLDTIYPLVQVYDNLNEQILPEKVKILNSSSIQIDFPELVSGYVVIAKGGHIVSGSVLLVDISDQTTVASTFTSVTSSTVVHNLNTAYPLVQVYNTLDEQVIPQTIKVLNSSSVQVNFPTPQSGYVVVAKAGHIISGSNENALLLENEPGSYYLDYDNFTNVPAIDPFPYTGSAIISGSLIVTGSVNATAFTGDGSGLTGVGAFPFTGSAGISGSLTVDGTLTATTIVETSSERFKENINNLPPSLDLILGLRPVTFNRVGSDRPEIGFIAEQTYDIYPEVVVYDEHGRTLGIEYSRLTVPLVKAIQDLSKIIRNQDIKIEDLTRKLDEKL